MVIHRYFVEILPVLTDVVMSDLAYHLNSCSSNTIHNKAVVFGATPLII